MGSPASQDTERLSMETETWLYFYKCRWCGAVFSQISTDEPDMVIYRDKTRTHACDNDRIGSAELLGCRRPKDGD